MENLLAGVGKLVAEPLLHEFLPPHTHQAWVRMSPHRFVTVSTAAAW